MLWVLGTPPCSSEPLPGGRVASTAQSGGISSMSHTFPEGRSQAQEGSQERWLCGRQLTAPPFSSPLVAVAGEPSVVSHCLASSAANQLCNKQPSTPSCPLTRLPSQKRALLGRKQKAGLGLGCPVWLRLESGLGSSANITQGAGHPLPASHSARPAEARLELRPF